MYQNCSLTFKFHLLIPEPTDKISTGNRQSKSVYAPNLRQILNVANSPHAHRQETIWNNNIAEDMFTFIIEYVSCVFVCVCVCLCVCVCVYMYIYVCVWIIRMYVCIHVCTYTHIHTHRRTQTHTHTFACTHNTHAHSLTHTHTHTHKDKHTS